MKIAVISTLSMLGKTYFAMTAGTVYAHVMKEPVYFMTTGTFEDHFHMAPEIDVKMVGHTPELQAALRASSISSAESFATSFTKDGVYPICEFSDPASASVKAATLKGFGSIVTGSTSMILVEIDNAADADLNTEIIKNCDVALILASPEMGVASKIKKIKDRYAISIPTYTVFNMYNPIAVSLKDIQSWHPEKFFTYTYNATALKYLNKRALDRMVEEVAKGGNAFGTMRNEIYNIVKAMYYPIKIPEVARWS